MENTSKIQNLTNDLKAFEQMMKEQRKENHVPEIEFEIDTDEDSPADILLQASDMLMECSVMVAKAAFLVGLMEAETDEDEEDNEDTCDNCPTARTAIIAGTCSLSSAPSETTAS